jgi:hypothetical protein
MRTSCLVLIATAHLLAALPGKLPAQTTIHVRMQNPPECARLGAAFRALDGELFVIGVTAGAPADEAGLRPGDRVTLIDSVPASLPKLDTLASTLRPGKVALFQVRRGDGEHAISIVAAPGECRPQERRLISRVETMAAVLDRLETQRGQAGRALIFRLDTAQLRQEAARLRLEQVIRTHIDTAGHWIVQRQGESLIMASPARVPLQPDSARRASLAQGLKSNELILFHAGAALELGLRSVAGVELSELNPELARYFSGVAEGLLILRVAPETPGARGGLVPGDVVVRAAGEPVRTISAFRSIILRARGEPVPLAVVRDGKRLELRLPLEF